MPTCLEIVTQALTMAKVIASGEAGEASEADDGLFALQGLYEYWFVNGMFGRLRDKQITANYIAEPGERLRLTSTVTITYPTTVVDSQGITRPVYDLSAIETYDTQAGTRELRVWETGRGNWVRLDGLILTDEAPLATRGRLGLASALATAYVDQFGQGKVTPGIQRNGLLFGYSLSQRMGGDIVRQPVEYF